MHFISLLPLVWFRCLPETFHLSWRQRIDFLLQPATESSICAKLNNRGSLCLSYTIDAKQQQKKRTLLAIKNFPLLYYDVNYKLYFRRLRLTYQCVWPSFPTQTPSL